MKILRQLIIMIFLMILILLHRFYKLMSISKIMKENLQFFRIMNHFLIIFYILTMFWTFRFNASRDTFNETRILHSIGLYLLQNSSTLFIRSVYQFCYLEPVFKRAKIKFEYKTDKKIYKILGQKLLPQTDSIDSK